LLAAASLAAVLRAWWPLELAALMLAVGVALDAALYHRALAYQPGWVAVPFGLLELGAVVGAAALLGIEAPLVPALVFFAASWLVTQVLGHAVFPLVRLSYGEDGGELGRAGPLLAASVLAVLAFAGGVAWGSQPPTVRLSAGVHRGPLVLDEPQRLVGERGAVVEGGIVVTSDDVTIRDVTVVGGENGIEIDRAGDVVVEDVRVVGARADGIHARQSSVTIEGCTVVPPDNKATQGIDVSFAATLPPSRIEDCTVLGGDEGIVTYMAHAEIRRNTVRGTTLRGISMNEMSMGLIAENDVREALGIGIFCGDYSICRITRNRVTGTRPDVPSSGRSRAGYAIVAHYGSTARVVDNVLVANEGALAAFINSRILRG
ncbi:MAG: right-handed parallel beta-helix repeat-containing protein, partial [Actinomycetota bacterium]|nr:right-handed parallel beta-helix repeat-containing protein [Actinomycetota bacterium]